MNHTAWCKECNRWRTWYANSEKHKYCIKCHHIILNASGLPAKATGVRYPWYLTFNPLTGVRKMVRWFSPNERLEQMTR